MTRGGSSARLTSSFLGITLARHAYEAGTAWGFEKQTAECHVIQSRTRKLWTLKEQFHATCLQRELHGWFRVRSGVPAAGVQYSAPSPQIQHGYCLQWSLWPLAIQESPSKVSRTVHKAHIHSQRQGPQHAPCCWPPTTCWAEEIWLILSVILLLFATNAEVHVEERSCFWILIVYTKAVNVALLL